MTAHLDKCLSSSYSILGWSQHIDFLRATQYKSTGSGIGLLGLTLWPWANYLTSPWNGDKNAIYLRGLLWRLNELRYKVGEK